MWIKSSIFVFSCTISSNIRQNSLVTFIVLKTFGKFVHSGKRGIYYEIFWKQNRGKVGTSKITNHLQVPSSLKVIPLHQYLPLLKNIDQGESP